MLVWRVVRERKKEGSRGKIYIINIGWLVEKSNYLVFIISIGFV